MNSKNGAKKTKPDRNIYRGTRRGARAGRRRRRVGGRFVRTPPLAVNECPGLRAVARPVAADGEVEGRNEAQLGTERPAYRGLAVRCELEVAAAAAVSLVGVTDQHTVGRDLVLADQLVPLHSTAGGRGGRRAGSGLGRGATARGLGAGLDTDLRWKSGESGKGLGHLVLGHGL
jgi:hypothetical protein